VYKIVCIGCKKRAAGKIKSFSVQQFFIALYLSLYPFSHKIHTKSVALLSNLFYNKQKEVTYL